MNSCPDDAQIDAVLDRIADATVAERVRAHVQECAACLTRHGTRFELELWAAGIGAPRETTVAPLPLPRLLERIAVAAVIVALVLAAARISTSGDLDTPSSASTRTADVEVLEFETRQWTTGPEGSVDFRRSFGASGASRGRVALMNEEEIRTGRDGVAVVHERFLPLCAAARE